MEDSSQRAPRVLLADDQSILRESLRALLDADQSLTLVAAAADKPDVVLIDLSLPNMDGLGAIREIKRRSPGTKALVLTIHKTAAHIRAALQAGADGYLLKEASRAELLMAIDSVLQGKSFISPAVSQQLVERYLEQGGAGAGRGAARGKLTARETEVLSRIAGGERNREIAEQLAISVKTVEKHRSNLMRKLKLHNTAALTSYAIEHRLTGMASRSAKD